MTTLLRVFLASRAHFPYYRRMTGKSTIYRVTAGGVAASHPKSRADGMRVATSTPAGRNVVRHGLVPIACWRAHDTRFDFDSSFVLSDIATELCELKRLLDALAGEAGEGSPAGPPSLTVFGHADPVGMEDYNKFLSGRRAAAIYGLLTRREDIWEDLYSNTGQFTQPVQGDLWGLKTIQRMLDCCGFPPGRTDGGYDARTGQAVRDFQTQQGLQVDGDPGKDTRKKLFRAYMDRLCVDAQGTPFSMNPANFISEGKDPAGKGDFQGCGEFNPSLLFSEKEEQELSSPTKREERNAANAPNRRVLIFLFRTQTHVLPDAWPCPRAEEGTVGCRKRFWSDYQRRLARTSEHREYELTQDTFACRFYDRMANSSPCERGGERISTLQWLSYVPRQLGSPDLAARPRTGGGAQLVDGSEVAEDSYNNDYFVFDLKPLAGQPGFSLQGQAGERPYTPLYSFDLTGLLAALADLASLAKFLGMSLPAVPPVAPPATPGPAGPDMLDIAAECGGEAPPEQIPGTSIDDD